MLVCASQYILFLVWANRRGKHCIFMLVKFKMFHRAFQSIIALLGMGERRGKEVKKENIMTFKSEELISVEKQHYSIIIR